MVSLSSFLDSYKIPYREKVRYYEVKCPSGKHIDKNPSLLIYKDSLVCHCFVCNYHKSVEQYVEDVRKIKVDPITIEKVHNLKSEVKLKEVVKVELPVGFAPLTSEIPGLKIYKDTIKHFNIGYCKVGYKGKISDKCFNCFFYKHGDKWVRDKKSCYFAKGRVMTPITYNDTLLSIESRDLSGLASKKVLYPNGSRAHDTIFNYQNLDINKPLFVVEGIKSTIRIWNDIDKNVTAIFSNRIKSSQGVLLKQFKSIILIPDNGSAGNETEFDFKKLGIYDLKVVKLPEIVLCKTCLNKFRGSEKLDICPKCKSSRVSYCDVFDFDTDFLKKFIQEFVNKRKVRILKKI